MLETRPSPLAQGVECHAVDLNRMGVTPCKKFVEDEQNVARTEIARVELGFTCDTPLYGIALLAVFVMLRVFEQALQRLGFGRARGLVKQKALRMPRVVGEQCDLLDAFVIGPHKFQLILCISEIAAQVFEQALFLLIWAHDGLVSFSEGRYSGKCRAKAARTSSGVHEPALRN